jgi:hypothetical protein
MGAVPRTIVSLIRCRTLTIAPASMAPVPIIFVDATMSDGSAALLFRTRLDVTALADSDLIGLTAQQAYALAQERGVVL